MTNEQTNKSMSKYKTTTTSISVHLENESPIFGDSATIVKLEDEGAGMFIVLEQPEGEVRIDPEEFDFLIESARKLITEAKDAN
jgi:hypothetical protein